MPRKTYPQVLHLSGRTHARISLTRDFEVRVEFNDGEQVAATLTPVETAALAKELADAAMFAAANAFKVRHAEKEVEAA